MNLKDIMPWKKKDRERIVPLPDEVDPEGVKASFKKGVLKVTLPKSAEARTRRKKIQVT